MFKRKIVLAAVVAAPLAWMPAPVLAQGQGAEHSAQATSQAAAVGAGTKARSEKQSDKPLPPGIENNFPGESLPPGIARTRVQDDPVVDLPEEPVVEDTTIVEDPPEDCVLDPGGMLNLGCG